MISKRVLIITAVLLVAAASTSMAASVVAPFINVTTLDIANPATDFLDLGIAGIVHSGAAGGTPYATINGYLTTGYGVSDWLGFGIRRSAYATDGLALGSAVNNDGAGGTRYASWMGSTVSITDTLIRATYPGDATLDGSVNGADVSTVLGSLGTASGAVWAQGDFTYDGKVNGADFSILLGSLGKPALGLPPNAPTAAAAAAVPEPGTFALLFAGTAGFFFLRRKFN